MVSASRTSRSPKGKTPFRPRFEVGQIFRLYGDDYRTVHGGRLTAAQDRVLRDLAACRTGALGGHMSASDRPCGHEKPSYNSCNHRMCPKCRGQQRARWYRRQARDMLPLEYLHVVFTVPDEIAELARQNPELVYELLFYAASRAFQEVGRQWLGVELGFLIVLHLWGQLLNPHPHVHCVLPAGGISLADGRWVSLPPGGTSRGRCSGSERNSSAIQIVTQTNWARSICVRCARKAAWFPPENCHGPLAPLPLGSGGRPDPGRRAGCHRQPGGRPLAPDRLAGDDPRRSHLQRGD